jgi:hypothetical protein
MFKEDLLKVTKEINFEKFSHICDIVTDILVKENAKIVDCDILIEGDIFIVTLSVDHKKDINDLSYLLENALETENLYNSLLYFIINWC